jgi:hypothetical protein
LVDDSNEGEAAVVVEAGTGVPVEEEKIDLGDVEEVAVAVGTTVCTCGKPSSLAILANGGAGAAVVVVVVVYGVVGTGSKLTSSLRRCPAIFLRLLMYLRPLSSLFIRCKSSASLLFRPPKLLAP